MARLNYLRKSLYYLGVVLAISSCRASKETIGASIGATSAMLLSTNWNHSPAQQILFGAAGAVVGAAIGRELDERDRKIIADTAVQALELAPSGTKVGWRNPDSGHHGYIQPLNVEERANKQYCREYIIVVVKGDKRKPQVIRSTACRHYTSSSWEVRSQVYD